MNVLGINLTETYVGKRFRNTTDLLSGISGNKALNLAPQPYILKANLQLKAAGCMAYQWTTDVKGLKIIFERYAKTFCHVCGGNT